MRAALPCGELRVLVGKKKKQILLLGRKHVNMPRFPYRSFFWRWQLEMNDNGDIPTATGWLLGCCEKRIARTITSKFPFKHCMENIEAKGWMLIIGAQRRPPIPWHTHSQHQPTSSWLTQCSGALGLDKLQSYDYLLRYSGDYAASLHSMYKTAGTRNEQPWRHPCREKYPCRESPHIIL